MAIDGSKTRVDDARVKAALVRLQRALPLGGDMTPAFSGIGRVFKTGTQLRFRRERSPEGVPWAPSLRVLRDGGQTLSLTRRLRNSITFVAGHDQVEIGTNVVYGRVHQEGGYAGRASGKAGPVRRPKIVARPFLGASGEDIAEAVAVLNDHFDRAWNGG